MTRSVGRWRWSWCTRPTWRRSTAPGSSRCTQPGGGRALTGAEPAADDALRDPAPGGAAVIPPLLNDFIGLQKDTALAR